MANANTAAWYDSLGAKIRVGPVERYETNKGEVLIEVHAVAINPVDCAQQDSGILIEKYPYISGCDAAGTVVEIGEGVSHVSIGSRILAMMTAMQGQPRAAFQRYAIVPELLACPIPEAVTFHEACVLPLAFLTATAGLYHKDHLALPLPNSNTSQPEKTLLIWGGASSVGCVAIQLAVASSIDVITTASPKNFQFCKSLGVREVFDYNSSNVVEEIKAVLKGRHCVGVYEASGMTDSMEKAAEILSALGGGIMAPVRHPPANLPVSISAKWVESLRYLSDDEAGARYLWQTFLPMALQNGQIKALPQAEVVGSGLEAIQDGLDAWKNGVSAKKIVVEL